MTANKKTTSKSSPAPATKTATPPKPAKTAKTAAKTKIAAITSAQATAGLAALAAKAVVAKPNATVVSARIDVGFGNGLYLRGEGAGLSWDRGLPMTCVGNDLWQVALSQSSRPITVKFLVNDATWSTGPDFTVEPGASVTFAPAF